MRRAMDGRSLDRGLENFRFSVVLATDIGDSEFRTVYNSCIFCFVTRTSLFVTSL